MLNDLTVLNKQCGVKYLFVLNNTENYFCKSVFNSMVLINGLSHFRRLIILMQLTNFIQLCHQQY